LRSLIAAATTVGPKRHKETAGHTGDLGPGSTRGDRERHQGNRRDHGEVGAPQGRKDPVLPHSSIIVA
jgi:hypothetical protein